MAHDILIVDDEADIRMLIGGILEHCGIPGFLGNVAEFREDSDPESDSLMEFVHAWAANQFDSPPTAKALVTMCQSGGLMEDLLSGDPKRFPQILGQFLSRHRDQVVGRYKITRAGKSENKVTWKLVEVQP